MFYKLIIKISQMYHNCQSKRIIKNMTEEEKSELALSIYQDYIDLITKVNKAAMSEKELAYFECHCYYGNTAYLRLTGLDLDNAPKAIKDAWNQFGKKPDWIKLGRILTQEFKKIADLNRAIKYLR